MSDRLYQHLLGAPLDELDEEIVADHVASTVRALGRRAGDRPLPVTLDWSGLAVSFGPNADRTLLLVTASAPVK